MNEMEQWWNASDREKQLFSEKNLPHCHSVHHKLDKDRLESKLGLRNEKKATNHLRHGKTSKYTVPIPVAARSRTWICSRSHAGIAGSNPAQGHGYPSLMSVAWCQVQVSASG